MEKEFNLSEKIRFWNKKAGKQILFYDEKDVKEFIKRLKERYKEFGDIQDFINKLAGDNLNGKRI